MRRIAFLLMAMFVCLSGLVSVAQAAPAVVSVCGQDAGGNREAATEDARRRAVKQVLAQLLTEDNPQYSSLLAQYDRYAGTPQVFQRKKAGNKILLFSRVSVDTDSLRAAIMRQNEQGQENHLDHTAYFFVRVNVQGMENDDAAGYVQSVYRDTLERLGFAMEQKDAAYQLLNTYRGMPYETYSQQIRQKIRSNYEDVQLAVIGELDITEGFQDENGVTCQGNVRLSAVDILGNRVIGEYQDGFEVRRRTRGEAENFIMDRAAVNSARYIGNQIASYWTKQGRINEEENQS